MSDTKQYQESETFVPELTVQSGTFDTSGTAGAAHARLEDVSPVFADATRQGHVTAGKALDASDDTVDAALVTLPDSNVTREEAEKGVKARAAQATKAEKAEKTEKAPADEKAESAPKK